ncbi:aldehyde dehydrogenase family protein [Actinophytocola sp.]|uniref:aldehyde dehydrogenase family protein n=1 Tax=Actinophytocola sp. TaxID=1872138 RepID=UPI002ED02CE6
MELAAAGEAVRRGLGPPCHLRLGDLRGEAGQHLVEIAEVGREDGLVVLCQQPTGQTGGRERHEAAARVPFPHAAVHVVGHVEHHVERPLGGGDRIGAVPRLAFGLLGEEGRAHERAVPDLGQRLADVVVEVDTVRGLRVGDPTEHETFVGAVIDGAAANRLDAAITRAKSLDSHRLLAGGTVRAETGWFVDPTLFVTTDPTAFTMSEELFGPVLTVYVYDDWDTVLPLVDTTSPYALTCSIFATERGAIAKALDVLRDTAGMTYVNDKPTGALMGRQYFGGGRASGTNDKTGSALQRWVSGRFIKENMDPDLHWTYPYLGT